MSTNPQTVSTPTAAAAAGSNSIPVNINANMYPSPAAVSTSPSPPLLDESKLDELVLLYLRKRGYTLTEESYARAKSAPSVISTTVNQSSIGPDSAAASIGDYTMDLSLETHTNIYRSILSNVNNNNNNISNPLLTSPDELTDSYNRLFDWISNCLDIYSNELQTILWPIFINLYVELLHLGYPSNAITFLANNKKFHESIHYIELHLLSTTTDYEQFRTNFELQRALPILARKIDLHLSAHSYELLINYLNENNYYYLLSIINKSIQIKIISRKPYRAEIISEQNQYSSNNNKSNITDNMDQSPLITSVLNSTAASEFRWGVLPDIAQLHQAAHEQIIDRLKQQRNNEMNAAAAAIAAATATTAGSDDETAAADADSTAKPKSKRSGKSRSKSNPPVIPINPSLTDSAILETANNQVKLYQQTSESLIELPIQSPSAKIQYIDDLQNRAKLSANQLPSICMYTILNGSDSCSSISVATDGSQLAAGFEDSIIRIWDVKSASTAAAAAIDNNPQPTRLIGHNGTCTSLSFSSDNEYLLSSSIDSTIRLWHIPTSQNLVSYKGHNFPVWKVEFSPLGFYFASASYDRTARLWSTDRIYPLRLFVGHSSDVSTVKFHPNCNYIATGSFDSTIRLWDIQSGDCIRVLINPRDPSNTITSLAFDPEGRYLASGSDDGRVTIWDLATSKLINTYQHSNYTIPSSNPDTELTNNNNNKSIINSPSRISALDYSGSGELLVSGGSDSVIRVWQPKLGSGATTAASANSNSVGSSSSNSIKSPSLADYRTKRTPLSYLKFTPRNLLLAAGVFQS